MVDENGEQFVAYFLPTKETLKKTDTDKDVEDEDFDEPELAPII